VPLRVWGDRAGAATQRTLGTVEDSRDNKPRGQRPVRSHPPRTRNRWTALSHGKGHTPGLDSGAPRPCADG
jgi:hypothetical protein